MSQPASPRNAASDVIASLEFVHSADLSPAGTHVAWSRSRIDGNEENIELLLTEVASAETETLVGDGRATDAEWSPDGRSLAFLSLQGSTPQLAVMDIGTRELHVLTDFPQGVSSPPRFSPDGAHIAFCVGQPPRDKAIPYRVTRAIGWMDGLGLIDEMRTDIWVVDTTDQTLRRLTPDDRMHSMPTWLPDSRRIACLATAGHNEWRRECRIRIVDLDGTVHELGEYVDGFALASTADGELVVTSYDGGGTAGRLTIVRADGMFDDRTEGLDIDVHGDVIGDQPIPFADPHPAVFVHGSDALVRTQDREHLRLSRVTLHGGRRATTELDTDGCVYPVALRGDVLLYGSGDRLAPPDLRVRNLLTGEDVGVTATSRHNLARMCPLRVAALDVRTDGGIEVPTTFVAPADAKGPLPTVLLVHGGPATSFGEAFFADAQLLCEAGFGVLLVNPRGSRGYGDEYLHATKGRWGIADGPDFLAAADLAVAEGLADPQRLGVAGLSYGGYMTTWLITTTDRFAAAVAENPVTNLVSGYGTSDVGLRFFAESMGGALPENLDRFMASSPAIQAERVTTPTLLIVGDEDRRCPPEQALQFFARLRSVGTPAELVILPGGSHAASVNGAPVLRRAQNDALVEWMVRHLLGDRSVAE